jgi:TrmH family RNA methyltransferase
MPGQPEITSTANQRVKQLVQLRKRRSRDEAGVTLVEGRAELELAIAAGIRPITFYCCLELAGSAGQAAAEGIAGLGGEVVWVSRQVFDKIAYRESPDGWLAVVPAPATALDRLRLGTDPLVLICDGLEKPGNLGAILRTADAAAVTAVVATDPVTDWANPNVVRASKGTLFSVPVASASAAAAAHWVAGHGIRIVAAVPDADTLLAQADLTGPVAIAVGSEQAGLSETWLKRADVTVRIPMFGLADSLNVATSAAILIYEAVRQRLALQQPGDLSKPRRTR